MFLCEKRLTRLHRSSKPEDNAKRIYEIPSNQTKPTLMRSCGINLTLIFMPLRHCDRSGVLYRWFSQYHSCHLIPFVLQQSNQDSRCHSIFVCAHQRFTYYYYRVDEFMLFKVTVTHPFFAIIHPACSLESTCYIALW